MVASDNSEEDVLPKAKQLQQHPISLYTSEGKKLMRLKQFHKALDSFESGLKDEPDNAKCLLGKTKCLMRLGKFQDAWVLVDKILQIEPRAAEASILKGEVEYWLGDFESGFLTYWEGSEKRPHCRELRLGHEMCKRGINNAFEPFLLDDTDVKSVEMLYDDGIGKRKKIERAKAGRHLDKDMQFVNNMLHDPELASVYSSSKDLWNYLTQREEFWRLEKPDIKKRRKQTTYYGYTPRQLQRLALRKCASFEKALAKGDNKTCISLCRETLDVLDQSPNRYSSKTLQIEAHTHNACGMAYASEGDTKSAIACHNRELQIGDDYHITEIQKSALRCLGENHLKRRDFEKALGSFRRYLYFVDSEKEGAVVLYKMADCELCLGRLENARIDARKSLDIANFVNDQGLQCDVTMLLAEVEVKSHDMREAVKLYQEALGIAEDSGDIRRKEIEELISIFYDKIDDNENLERFVCLGIKMGREGVDVQKKLDVTLEKNNH